MTKTISGLIFAGTVGLIAWLLIPEKPKEFFLDCRENWQNPEHPHLQNSIDSSQKLQATPKLLDMFLKKKKQY